MFCKNCGKELPDTAKFCSGCGSPVTLAVPEEALDSQPLIQQPTTPEPPVELPEVQEIPETPSFQPEDAVNEVPAVEAAVSAPVKRRGKSGIIILGVGAVIALAVVFLVVKLISGLLGGGGGSSRTQAFAYLTDDYELMYLADLKEKTQPIEVSDKDYPNSVQFTKDGKTLYFQDTDNTLYKIAVSDLKKGSRPERVARDVSRYRLLDNGAVLYSKYDYNSSTYEVNYYTAKEDYRLIKECDNYRLDESQKNIYFTEYDREDEVYTLYKMAMKKDAQKEELVDDVSVFYTDWDASLLVFGERDYDPEDNNTLTVYSCKPGSDPVELVDDIYNVYSVKVDGGKVNFYYSVEDLEEYALYDLVTDNMAGKDAATLAEEPAYPDWSNDYNPVNIYFENGNWYYETNRGEKFSVDKAALIDRYGSAGEELDNYQVRSIANTGARERYSVAEEDYRAKRGVWNEANNRNRVRESLKEATTSQSSVSLYHYNNSEPSDPIATGINQSQMNYASQDGVFLYKKAAGVTGGTVCDVSDLGSYYDIYNYLENSSTDDDWYQNVGGDESVMDFDEDVTYISDVYVLNGKEVVIDCSFQAGPADNRRTERILYAYALGKTELTFSAEIAEDDYSGVELGKNTKGNDVLYFFTEVESKNWGALGDLNKYSGGKTETVVKEVYQVYILEDSNTIYAVTDISRKGEWELSLVQGDKLTMVTDEITGSNVTFLDSKQLLYIADGDLYLWNGKENRQIAKDVTMVWANAQEDYNFFYPW